MIFDAPMLITDFVLVRDMPRYATDPGPVPIRPGLAYMNEAVGDMFQDLFGPRCARLIGHACADRAARISERAAFARRRCCADPAGAAGRQGRPTAPGSASRAP